MKKVVKALSHLLMTVNRRVLNSMMHGIGTFTYADDLVLEGNFENAVGTKAAGKMVWRSVKVYLLMPQGQGAFLKLLNNARMMKVQRTNMCTT